jgi:hypothetical protein
MPNLLQQVGATPQKQPKYVPLFISHNFSGLVTQRSVVHDPSDVVTQKFYEGRPDALWQGLNVELTNRLTLSRRPGTIAFSADLYPTPPLRTFAFELTDGTIRVLVDTGNSGTLAITSASNATGSPLTTVYNGTFPGAINNGFVGLQVQIAGFVTNPANNGTYTVTASTATTLTVDNINGVAETVAATAFTAGAVYWDVQNGTTTLIRSKLPCAGQSYFVAVAGILYVGDGCSNWIYQPTGGGGVNSGVTVYGFGIPEPLIAPTVKVTESGQAGASWTPNTVFSTMGLIYDTGSSTIYQLQSVNANPSVTNTTQLGTTGSGQPPWNQSPGGTTLDHTGGGTITWTNFGPIVAWTAHTVYNNATVGGSAAQPCIVYDPNTKMCYVQSSSASSATSGSTYPVFNPGIGQHTIDGGGGTGCVWIPVGSLDLEPWQPNHSYPARASIHNQYSLTACVELTGLQNGLPTVASGQVLYFQVSSGGTSGSGYTPFGTTAIGSGNTISDNDLTWLSLGSYTWTALTQYTAWTANGVPFSALVDANGNFQVCVQSGISGGTQPTWNVTGYGGKTTDGGVIWANVGDAMSWATNTQWYLPSVGFAPPSQSQPYGGAFITDTNSPTDIEYAINSGLSGATAPAWATSSPGYTDDNGASFAVTSVSVVGGTATYHGTFTAGPFGTYLAGQQIYVTGFTNSGNNGYMVALTGNSTTFTVSTTSQVNETATSHAQVGLIWFNDGPFSQCSLPFQFGFAYSYSYESRSLDDYYSVNVLGTSQPPIPPGLSAPLPPPTGSLTGDVSSAAPVTQITGSNTGAVITIYGPLSTDPAVDSVIIWRSGDSADGGADMFELTVIPNVQGTAPGTPIGYWSFQDCLPSAPATINGVSYPGLDTLIPAPIASVNNPPPTGFLPMIYNFERIWGSVGPTVYFSAGPDSLVGNPNTQFNIADDIPFLATVVRIVKIAQGSLVFLTDSIQEILGGPSTGSFYSVELASGIGLGNYNALDTYMGEIYFFSADGQLMTLNPALSAQTIGFALGDQFVNLPSSGVSDATWIPSKVYVAALQAGIDNALFVGDGSTGWYRCNPHQVPGLAQGPQPVWSPFAKITNGCQMLYTTEISPGIKKLLIGSTLPNEPILERSLSVFTDNGTQYDAFFVMGAITLAWPGQLAVLKHLEMDFSQSGYNTTGYHPTVSFLIDEFAGTFTPFTLLPVYDPPSLYGRTTSPTSYSPNRYYFSGTRAIARGRFIQIKVDFGTTPNGDEMNNLTIFGRLLVET